MFKWVKCFVALAMSVLVATELEAEDTPDLVVGMDVALQGRSLKDPLLMAAGLRILLYNGLGNHTVSSWLREELAAMSDGADAMLIQSLADPVPWKGRVGGYFDDVMTVDPVDSITVVEKFNGGDWGFVAVYVRDTFKMKNLSVAVETLAGDPACSNPYRPQLCRWSVETAGSFAIVVSNTGLTPVTFSLVIE